ncbi:MAG: histidine--tRNA ligase [Thermodesulfobacteriota bacterium]|nr:histidine--tRNA ligase [Thermodesulfobacteriota bacterium]
MIKAIRGFHDILPGEVEKWHFVEAKARKIFDDFGFAEIKIPIAEKTELFTRSIGESTDIIEKEMYTFNDRKGESIALRPEATASVARAYIEHRLYENNRVMKLYFVGPMFRYERPQRGRYRQFHQINVEVLGTADPIIDAEIMALLSHFLTEIKVTEIELQINSLGCFDCRADYIDELRGFLQDKSSELCEDCRRRIHFNPLRTFDCKNKVCKEITSSGPSILDYICHSCEMNFKDVKRNLSHLGIIYKINPRLVRGLDYYHRTTFEVVTDKLGAQNAIAAGGRYDGLIKDLGGPDMPGLGFAIGLERLISLFTNQEDYANPPYVFIAYIGNSAKDKALQLSNRFRIMGIKTEMDYQERSLKSQMRFANTLKTRFVIIIGEDELAAGKAVLRNMEEHIQEEIDLENIIEEIKLRKEITYQ